MKRVHEARVNPSELIPTLQGLGMRGIIPTGALAWQSYPAGARAATFLPGAGETIDGSPIGFISPNLLTRPYMVTHLNWAARSDNGEHICQWKIQDSLGVTRRVFRFQNPGKETAGTIFGQSLTATFPPIPLLPSQGVRGVLAAENPLVIPELAMRGYLTALLVQPQIIPSLMAVAPTATGAVLPTTVAGTVLTEAATSWTYGSYAQLTGGLGTGALITAIVMTSTSTEDLQVAFATGGGGSEVDWGVFGMAEPLGANLVGCRYDLQPFPLFLPASTRLAARARGTNGSDTVNVGVEYIPLPIR